MGRQLASYQMEAKLPVIVAAHQSQLRRRLSIAEDSLQAGKIRNLGLAVRSLNRIIMYPGQVLSYWNLIGEPSAKRGYVKGMVLQKGEIKSDIGGGLCQLSNLIFWLTLHTPLEVVERWRHDYDVFPDSNRQVPFGAGATCSYPNIDLRIKNTTDQTFQLEVWLDENFLYGRWRAEEQLEMDYRVVERNHQICSEWWGGYSRQNQIFKQEWREDQLIGENLVAENQAVIMYEPLINQAKNSG